MNEITMLHLCSYNNQLYTIVYETTNFIKPYSLNEITTDSINNNKLQEK